MNLAEVFKAVAHKILVRVDLPGLASNEHEINGNRALKELFQVEERLDRADGSITWHYFADDNDPQSAESNFTFYDVRAKSASRTGRSPEWRLYYSGEFLECAAAGDLLVVVRTHNDLYFGLVFQASSSWFRAAEALFSIHDAQEQFDVISFEALSAQNLEFLGQQILEALDLEVALPTTLDDESLMLATFGMSFPTTYTLSDFARKQVDVDWKNGDLALIRWLEREEQLFRALEKVLISQRIQGGFKEVDEFIAFSLSVQNRRKSRMGHSLQNHLATLFSLHGLRFTAQARTERRNKPDFIFPGESEYQDISYDASLLVMLGAKSSSKDRWRQVLVEAERIPKKHLCTLQPGISEAQIDEMYNQQLTLVIPQDLHITYAPSQQNKLLSIGGFIEFVKTKQPV